MWSDYAEDHKGAVLRIEPNVAKKYLKNSSFSVPWRIARSALRSTMTP